MENQSLESQTTEKVATLGERMKTFECTEQVEPYQAFIVRADGNRFSKYTKGLQKPFDEAFQRAMVKTANGLMDHFSCATIFVCSDEISLVFSPVCSQEESEANQASNNKQTHIYSGRHNKIETLVSSKASVLFNKFMLEEVRLKRAENPGVYAKTFLDRVESQDAIFDARLIPFPLGSEFEIVNNLIWRSCYDCHRNTVASYGRHVLGTKACQNKKSYQMIQLMKSEKDFDFDEVPMAYKFGVFGKKALHVLANEQGESYTRHKHFNFCTNLVKEDRDRTLDLFMKKDFEEELVTHDEYVL